MAATNDTVHRRIERARIELTSARVAAGLAVIAALGFTLLFVQEPTAHDALHNFRHAAGITCH
ncbi:MULTISPECIES: CbtB domain-containing protein [Halococcus]|uniref:Cobalamin cluster protein n=1 Tax=Halococcus salifodinae DSM 8989 TaxID=1227456 RepID=M0N6N5_9EURY|nr:MULTISPECIES: CbtB domain-containing protein [Halococcus]EMA53218.1 hypothetical protein C450_07887 [Halococcus salifodinae DSM 8989]